MGPDTAYYTEDILKLNKDDNDYADRIDLTLEYTITFMKEKLSRINELIPQFNDIQLPDEQEETGEDKLDPVVEDDTTNADEDIKDAKLAAADIAPKLTDNFEKDTVIAYIKQKDYRLEVLELLATSQPWDEIPAFKDGTIFENAMAVMEGIETLIDEKTEDKDEGTKQSDSDEETPVDDKTNVNPEPGQDLEQIDLQKSMAELIVLIKSLYNESNSLLRKKLMLYADLMEKTNGTVSPDGFKFDISRIPNVLELWKKVAGIKEDADAFLMSPMLFFPKVIHAARATFPALVETIDAAILNEGKNREREPLRKLRSQQMHKAAEALKDQKIAWKVGDKHIADIREIEKGQGFETGYTYISVENFSQRYYNAEELKHFKGSEEDLGPEYVEARTKNDKIAKDRFKLYK